MCNTLGAGTARPHWGALYGATVPPLAALAVVEVSGPPNVIRLALRLALAVGAFAGMAMWVRSNRAAFDLSDWCDCAGQTMTVRVIESRRPLRSTPPSPTPVPTPLTTAEEFELAQR